MCEDVMQCSKCKNYFPENKVDLHHLIPKFMGGTDKDGRRYLCKKCHNILHNTIPKILFQNLSSEKKEIVRKKVKEYSERWIDNG